MRRSICKARKWKKMLIKWWDYFEMPLLRSYIINTQSTRHPPRYDYFMPWKIITCNKLYLLTDYCCSFLSIFHIKASFASSSSHQWLLLFLIRIRLWVLFVFISIWSSISLRNSSSKLFTFVNLLDILFFWGWWNDYRVI